MPYKNIALMALFIVIPIGAFISITYIFLKYVPVGQWYSIPAFFCVYILWMIFTWVCLLVVDYHYTEILLIRLHKRRLDRS